MTKRTGTSARPGGIEEGGTTAALSDSEVREADRRTNPRAAIVFETVRREGQQELERPAVSLAFSGLAAGLSMGFSLVATGVIQAALPPNAPWTPLIANLGYTLGFLIVVMGRQQLFTENTVTAIVPLLDSRRKWSILGNVVRMWGIVLLTNLAGAALFALLVAHTDSFAPTVKAAFLDLGTTTLSYGFTTTLVKGIFAGWLIALMVWLLPAAENSRLAVVIIITYLVGAAGLSHIIAGSVEGLYAVVEGAVSLPNYLANFLAPVFVGNCLGGVLLVSILNYAQIAQEGADAG